MSQPLLEVLRAVEGVPTSQEIFTYRELARLLSAYILSHRHRFFDAGNSFVCNVGDDPLGRAFGCRAFHRSQAAALLRQNMLPLDAPRPKRSRAAQTDG